MCYVFPHSCNGKDICKDGTLECNDNSCIVNCNDEQSCGGNTVIDGGTGDLTVKCDGMIFLAKTAHK